MVCTLGAPLGGPCVAFSVTCPTWPSSWLASKLTDASSCPCTWAGAGAAFGFVALPRVRVRLGLPFPFKLAAAPSNLFFGVRHWNESSDIWAICRVTLVVGSGWPFQCRGPNMMGDPMQVLVIVGWWRKWREKERRRELGQIEQIWT